MQNDRLPRRGELCSPKKSDKILRRDRRHPYGVVQTRALNKLVTISHLVLLELFAILSSSGYKMSVIGGF